VKAAVNRECDLRLEISAQEEGTQYELASLFNKAYMKDTDMENRNIRLQSCRCFAR
jgi:hypothetical protein